VQRDHVALLEAAARLLAPDGVLIFSTNFRRFKLDEAALPDLVVEDITRDTIPRDFARRPRIHQAWRIQRR
jgi:23S rRNA (guanine2445-N2)-methyltransferase / 23S rRNA (guanine2069-N7)-methyltransferase